MACSLWTVVWVAFGPETFSDLTSLCFSDNSRLTTKDNCVWWELYSSGVVFWWGFFPLSSTCATEPQDQHCWGVGGGHLKVRSLKEVSPLAATCRNKGLKPETLSPPSLNNTPDQLVLFPPAHLPSSALPQPLSVVTRMSAGFLCQVNLPITPSTDSHSDEYKYLHF